MRLTFLTADKEQKCTTSILPCRGTWHRRLQVRSIEVFQERIGERRDKISSNRVVGERRRHVPLQRPVQTQWLLPVLLLLPDAQTDFQPQLWSNLMPRYELSCLALPRLGQIQANSALLLGKSHGEVLKYEQSIQILWHAKGMHSLTSVERFHWI